jgi:MFS transporter, SP family, arabinose:H+ symporter
VPGHGNKSRDHLKGSMSSIVSRKYLVIAATVSGLGGLLFGFDNIVISGAIPYLTQLFHLDATGVGWAAGCALIGCIAGAMSAGAFVDYLGQKKGLAVCAACFALSSAGIWFAASLNQFVVWRIIGGIGIGAASIIAPMYIAEIAPTRLRGRLVTLYQVGIVLGILAAVFINMQIQRMGDDAWNTAVGWRWMFLMGLFPAIAFAAIIVPAPESPRWLMKMGRIAEAVTVLPQINGEVTANREAAEIQSSLEVEEGHLSELLTSFRRPLLLGIMLACFSQTSGITATLSFLPEVFQAAGTATADAFMQSVLVGVVNLIFTLIGLWLIDVTGRKTLIVAGSFVQFISFALVGLLFYLHGSGALVVVFVMTFVIGHAFGNGVACWVIISEIYPAKIRGRAMSIATTTLWMCSYLANQLFPIMMKHLGPDGTFWSFSGAALVAMICFWKLVPETKGRSLEQITRFWVEKRAS